MPDDPAHPEPPRLEYAPDVDPGGIYIARHDGGLTVIVPPAPVGWWVLLGSGLAALLLLGFAAWHVTTRGQMTADWLLLLIFLAITCGVGWVIGYGCHLSVRHVRIDVDERQLRRTAQGLFGKRERAWDRRRITELHRTGTPTGNDALDCEPMWEYLMVRLHDGRQHVLLDSPDPNVLSAVEDALREALELPVTAGIATPCQPHRVDHSLRD